jgi:hypothetical protein
MLVQSKRDFYFRSDGINARDQHWLPDSGEDSSKQPSETANLPQHFWPVRLLNE